MFNMAKQSDIGYKLVIIYNRKQNKYHLTGYTAHGDTKYVNRIEYYDQDGATLHFDSLEETIKHIANYD